MPIKRAILIGVALALLIAIPPNRGTFPSTADLIALQQARQVGDDQTEWSILAKWVSLRPRNRRIWERMAILDQLGNHCDQSIREFRMAANLGKLATGSLLPFSQCLLDSGQFEAIIELLGPSSNADFGSSPVLYGILAQAYIGNDQPESAIAVSATWAAKDPQNGTALYTHGLYLALLKPDEALPNLVAASERNPLYNPAVIKMQTAINKASLSDDTAYQMVELGRAYGNLHEWELAEYAFLQACQINPQYAEAFAWLGEARQQLGGTGEAELQKAQSIAPDSILVQALNALRLQREGQVESAITILKIVAAQEADNPQWLIALAKAEAMSGDLASAASSFQDAINLDPKNPTTWQALAEFSLSHQYEINSIGIPAAQQAQLLSPKDARSLDLVCQAEMIQGNLAEAESKCQDAILVDPHYAPAHYHLALILLQRNQPEEATAALKKAFSLGSREAENVLKQLYPDGQ